MLDKEDLKETIKAHDDIDFREGNINSAYAYVNLGSTFREYLGSINRRIMEIDDYVTKMDAYVDGFGMNHKMLRDYRARLRNLRNSLDELLDASDEIYLTLVQDPASFKRNEWDEIELSN